MRQTRSLALIVSLAVAATAAAQAPSRANRTKNCNLPLTGNAGVNEAFQKLDDAMGPGCVGGGGGGITSIDSNTPCTGTLTCDKFLSRDQNPLLPNFSRLRNNEGGTPNASCASVGFAGMDTFVDEDTDLGDIALRLCYGTNNGPLFPLGGSELVNLDDPQTLTNKTIDGGDSGVTTTRAPNADHIKPRRHDTDCTTLTDGEPNELCVDQDDGKVWVCVPSNGPCNTPAEWVLVGGTGGGVSTLTVDALAMRLTSTAVTNTTSETALWTMAVSGIAQGRVYRLTDSGTLKANASDTATLRVKLAGTTLCSIGSIAPPTSATGYRTDATVTIRTAGGAGVAQCHIRLTISGQSPIDVDTNTTGLALLGTQILTMTAQWAGAAAPTAADEYLSTQTSVETLDGPTNLGGSTTTSTSSTSSTSTTSTSSTSTTSTTLAGVTFTFFANSGWTQPSTAGASRYAIWGDGGFTNLAGSGAAIANDCTLKALICAAAAGPGAGASWTYTVMLGNDWTTVSDTGITCTLSDTNVACPQDNTHTQAALAGQVLTIRSTASSGTVPVAQEGRCALVCE